MDLCEHLFLYCAIITWYAYKDLVDHLQRNFLFVISYNAGNTYKKYISCYEKFQVKVKFSTDV